MNIFWQVNNTWTITNWLYIFTSSFCHITKSTLPNCQVLISKSTFPSPNSFYGLLNEFQVAHKIFFFWYVQCLNFFYGLLKLLPQKIKLMFIHLLFKCYLGGPSPLSFFETFFSYFFWFDGFLKLDSSLFKIQTIVTKRTRKKTK